MVCAVCISIFLFLQICNEILSSWFIFGSHILQDMFSPRYQYQYWRSCDWQSLLYKISRIVHRWITELETPYQLCIWEDFKGYWSHTESSKVTESWFSNHVISFIYVSSIGYFFRSPLWRWRKMAALPLPAAILDDLISGSRKWGHPRWRPEAEGPPFCATATTGIEKSTPSPGWCHFRRRHLGFKMAAVEMTSGGRRDAREDVLQTSASSMSHAIL